MTLPNVPDAPKSAEVVALESRDEKLQEQITALDKRVTALEAAAPTVPPPAVVVPITAEVEAELAKLVEGQAVVLRGPAEDFVLLVV